MVTSVHGTIIILICIMILAASTGFIIQRMFNDTANRTYESTTKQQDNIVGSALTLLDVKARGTGNKDLDFFYIRVKLRTGSTEDIDLRKTLISFNSGTARNDYSYTSNIDCSLIPYGNYSLNSLLNETNQNNFGILYNILVHGDNNSIGLLTPGDVATLCFKSPLTVGDTQSIIFWLTTPGSQKITLETQTPPVIKGEYVTIFSKVT
ncbi:MAG: hypothetical protein QXG00_04415 [Candidatus Woesearchaeota archaeon]